MEGAQGGSPMNLDIMVRVRMAKEMKMKDRQIEELTEQKVSFILPPHFTNLTTRVIKL